MKYLVSRKDQTTEFETREEALTHAKELSSSSHGEVMVEDEEAITKMRYRGGELVAFERRAPGGRRGRR